MKFLPLLLLLAGCTSTTYLQNPATTATQQLITSSAEQKAIDSLQYTIPKRLVYVDKSNFTGSEFQVELFKSKLLQLGIPLAYHEGKEDIVIELFSAANSYNSKSLILGIPSIPVSGSESIPSLSIYSKYSEIAISQIDYICYDAKTGAPISYSYSSFGIQTYTVVNALFLENYETPKLTNVVR